MYVYQVISLHSVNTNVCAFVGKIKGANSLQLVEYWN